MVGAERGTLPGSAGLMEQGWFNQSGGLMLGCKWSKEWGEKAGGRGDCANPKGHWTPLLTLSAC